MKDKEISIYDALLRIRSELTFGMAVTINEDGFEIAVGKERFEVDEGNAAGSSEDCVNEFFVSASWLAGARIVEQ